MHKNVRLPEVIVFDNLDSDHLAIDFTYWIMLESGFSAPVDKFTDWEWFQTLAYEFISHRIQMNCEEEADRAVRDFTLSLSLYTFSI